MRCVDCGYISIYSTSSGASTTRLINTCWQARSVCPNLHMHALNVSGLSTGENERPLKEAILAAKRPTRAQRGHPVIFFVLYSKHCENRASGPTAFPQCFRFRKGIALQPLHNSTKPSPWSASHTVLMHETHSKTLDVHKRKETFLQRPRRPSPLQHNGPYTLTISLTPPTEPQYHRTT